MDWNLALSVILSGVIIVFLALVILIVAVWIIGKIMTAGKGKGSKTDASNQVKKAEVAPPASAPKAAMKVERGIPGEVIAAISAAVAQMMGGSGSFAIKSVRRTREARPIWSLAGMMRNTKPF